MLMIQGRTIHRAVMTTATAALALGATACTGQIKDSFRLAQQEESFNSSIDINTKIDLLWVVDNSSSMDVSQKKLRDGFTAFANKYMQPTWDIRVAVITTDTYLAGSSFQTFLSTVVPNSVGYTSPYISGRIANWTNPSWNSSLVDGSGTMTAGIKYNEMVPAWAPSLGRLLPGYHDGPLTAMCFEGMSYFLRGAADCRVRDVITANTGTTNCLTPGAGESSITQCVNTVENDTVRSGKAIISTTPPSGTAADSTWTQGLVNDFMINVSTGSNGHGSERGLGSLQELITDNESTATAFFRQGSLRGIIFVSDEDDQTMDIEASLPAGFNPWTHYACDQSGLSTLNPASNISGANGNCCSGGSCRYGSEGTTCSSKTVDGLTYTLSYCPLSANLKSVSTIKSELDTFFLNLDGSGATDPKYFTVAITPLTSASITALQNARVTEDANVGALKTVAVDRGDRYIELGTLVGNGSTSKDIGENDYSTILDEIGTIIIQKKGTFSLRRQPTSEEDMLVWIQHANGSTTSISSANYTISGSTITITDLNTVLGLSSSDKIVINYQPRSRG